MFQSALRRCLRAPIAMGMRTKHTAFTVRQSTINKHSAAKRLYTANSAQTSTKTSLETASVSDEFIELDFHGQKLKFAHLWLRDNCRCEKCYSTTLQQRKITIQGLDLNIKALSVQHNNGTVDIDWSDGHRSTYQVSWLAENSYPGLKKRTDKFLWDKERIQGAPLPETDYTDFMHEPEAMSQHLENVLKYGFAFLTGAPIDYKETVKAAERIGFPMETLFGRSWEFHTGMSVEDKSFSRDALGAHTDNTYLPVPAGLQLLHCLEHTGEGGLNLIVDGFFCAEKLRAEDKASFDMLKEVRVLHEFFERSVDAATECMDSMLKTHPSTDEMICVRFCEYDRAPIATVPQEKVQVYLKGMAKLAKIIESPENEHWVKLTPGTILFMDNWRVLHGRSAFTGQRHMCGTYLSREVWTSRTKLMGMSGF